MKKKIIAIVMVTVLIVTCFAACKKKEITITDTKGNTYICVTDKEGNTVLDEDGNIKVYVTNAEGKIEKDENGNEKSVAVTFPNAVANGEVLETPLIKLVLPKGWTSDDAGVAYKDGNKNSTLKAVKVEPLQNTGGFDELFTAKKEEANMITSSIIEKNPNSTLEFSNCELTDKKIPCGVIEFKYVDETGGVAWHTVDIYYAHGSYFYNIHFDCRNTYDANFNIIDMLNKNLTIK